jgi:hypothetical protein
VVTGFDGIGTSVVLPQDYTSNTFEYAPITRRGIHASPEAGINSNSAPISAESRTIFSLTR